MEKWFKICLLLCLFGLLKEMRPSEPFLTEYLVGPWKNLTSEEVVQVVFPVWTYSYLALLIVVFLVTDYLLYKPVIVFEGVCYFMTWCVLIWGQGVAAMQGVEFLYAAATATQIAYNTYIYAQVPLEKFQIVTAYTQAALLTGRCLAGIVGQVLVATELCDYYELNYISLSFVSAATILSLFLPSVSQSIYFHRRKKDIPSTASVETIVDKDTDVLATALSTSITESTPAESEEDEGSPSFKSVYRLLWFDFTSAYSTAYTLKWSLWWAFAMCGYFQVLNYIQPLWEEISPSGTTSIYNGAVEAAHTFLSAIAVIGVGYVPVDWSVYGEPVIAVISIFEGIMLYLAGSSGILWVAYITYMAYCITYSILITIASSEVAKGLKQESYGLVFGINTFMALLFQTILTLIVADQSGLALGTKDQFKVYGSYYLVLGAAFLTIAGYSAGRARAW